MVFNKDAVIDLKASAVKVLEAILGNEKLSDIHKAFNSLNEMWDSPGNMLFRRIYGHASISMPGDQHLKNWESVLVGMNTAKGIIDIAEYGYGKHCLLANMTGFYTGLSVMESAHIDDINEFYADK